MALFKKRDETKLNDFSKLPELPQLPELPELPENEYPDEEEGDFLGKIPQLPRFPNDSLGQKFSQNTIKEAITGKKEDKVFADEFDENEEDQMMQKPSMNFKYPIPKKITSDFRSEEFSRRRELEPIFVRMDKFQEGLNSLENAKKQIFEIEKLMKNIREIKDAEEKELESWERQIQIAKSQIDKVDKSIFSRLE
jgi:soluble cytochrome b562